MNSTRAVVWACLSEVSARMISLTRLNNHPITVNSDLIKFVEQAPDTLLTLINGEKIIVRESAEEVLNRVVQFRRAVLQGVFPAWDRVPPVLPVPPAGAEPDDEQPEAPEER